MFIVCRVVWDSLERRFQPKGKDVTLTHMSGYFVEYHPKSGEKLFHVPVRSPNQVCG
jgi:hypothetical protein